MLPWCWLFEDDNEDEDQDEKAAAHLHLRLTPACAARKTVFNPGVMPTHARPSQSAEDYLERIHELIERKGYARVVDIASSLKVKQASVTNMVKKLGEAGYLKYEKYRGLILTTAGKTLASKIAQRHQLLTDFLKLLGLDDRVIYHDVEGMEHHISSSTLRAIEALTAQLRRRPALLARLESAIA